MRREFSRALNFVMYGIKDSQTRHTDRGEQSQIDAALAPLLQPEQPLAAKSGGSHRPRNAFRRSAERTPVPELSSEKTGRFRTRRSARRIADRLADEMASQIVLTAARKKRAGAYR